MRSVTFEEIYQLIHDELIRINTSVREEIRRYFHNYQGPFWREINENVAVAEREKLPLCQDTGIVEFFVFKGFRIQLETPIEKILNRCVQDVYSKFGFRKSIVSQPILNRTNTKTNTPCVVHVFELENDVLEILTIVKGGGSENLTRLLMLEPNAEVAEIIDAIQSSIGTDIANACPPVHIGVGLGGTSDFAILLSRLALFDEDFRLFLPDIVEYPELAEKLRNKLNSSKIGAQALGYGDTVLKVRGLGYPTHIATLPVAVSVDCFLNRTGRVRIL